MAYSKELFVRFRVGQGGWHVLSPLVGMLRDLFELQSTVLEILANKF